jgi:hypothetical protein
MSDLNNITFGDIEWIIFRIAFVLFLIYELANFAYYLYRKWGK